MVQNGDDSVTWSIEPSRAPDRDKASIALGLDAGPRLSQLIVWDTGETELDLADLDAGTHTSQDRIIGRAPQPATRRLTYRPTST